MAWVELAQPFQAITMVQKSSFSNNVKIPSNSWHRANGLVKDQDLFIKLAMLLEFELDCDLIQAWILITYIRHAKTCRVLTGSFLFIWV
jgi:hypothetical protein